MSEEQQTKKYPAPVAAKFAGSTFLATLPFGAHFGATGLLLSGISALVAYRHGPEIYDMARDTLSFLPSLEGRKAEPGQAGTPQGRSLWDRAFGIHPDQDSQMQEDEPQDEQAPANDADFVRVDQQSTDVPGIPRFTVEQICSHITPNSYKIYIGRSLTLPKYPALSINFFRRHLKVIGASQKGKSSMAAALLEIMLRTHDTKHLLGAILDKEDRTGKLFTNDPHIIRVRFDDGRIEQLHARSNEQVLAHLELLIQILDQRAAMSVTQVRQQPLIVIYLEEFLMLKKELKARASGLRGEAKEQANADYERLIYCVNKIAGLGLKLNMQFLICAQVDYRDDDLYEAFANITAGFCFCVKASAASSAGFLQTELLNKNAKDNKPGQCVAETPDGHDLILAPDYPLEQRLLDLEAKEHSPRSHSPETSLLELRDAAGNTGNGKSGNAREPLYKPVGTYGNARESSRDAGNIPTDMGNEEPEYTQAEETQVLLAYAELLRQGKPVTRSAIRDYLGWTSNRQFSRVVKPVCDKHHIAEREGWDDTHTQGDRS